MNNTPNRWAAVVPVLVEAGCEGPPSISLHLISPRSAGKTWLAVAAFEKWFSQTVVPWIEAELHELDPPFYDSDDGRWYWCVHDDSGSDPSPTEAYLQCAESLAGVIGGK